MRKSFKLFAISCFVMFSFNVSGQIGTKSDKQKSISDDVGSTYLIGGINLGQLKTDISGLTVKTNRLLMAHFGYTDVTKLNEKWGFRTGVILSADGGKNGSVSGSIVYACVPIQAQYFIDDKFSAYGGPSFDFGLFSISDGDVSFDDKSFSRYWNPCIGFGVEAKLSGIKLYANYNAGLADITAKDYRTAGVKVTKNVIQFGIGILLKQK